MTSERRSITPPIAFAEHSGIAAALELSGKKPPPHAQEPRPVDKIIIAIHGIGSQSRSSTVRTVATRFGDRATPPVPTQPLGYFNLGNETKVTVSLLDPENDPELRKIGFAEVFWADIPKDVVKQDDLLEETKAWGRTVVGRAQSAYDWMMKAKETARELQVKAKPGQTIPKVSEQFVPADFDMGIAVVDEIVETVGVLEALSLIFGKMGLFKFELAPLLRDYVGDVQLVADFPFLRDKVLFRFHSALCKIAEEFARHNALHGGVSNPEIHIVAHSEGTVISFLGLLEAFTGKIARDPEDKDPRAYDSKAWISRVRGFMTIGSPIDKHLLLWDGLWTGVRGKLASCPLSAVSGGPLAFVSPPASPGDVHSNGVELPQKIRWRNYYDFGDPVGFQLDTAVEFLCEERCGAFEFVTAEHDIGFSRYWLPGKAHVDYWTDAEVFGHFIDDVVSPDPSRPPKRPQSLRMRGILSTAIPYLASFLAHVGAVFILYKGIIALNGALEYKSAPWPLLLLSVLLACMTVAARIPRLVKTEHFRWHFIALAFFLVGIGSIWKLPDETVAYLTCPLLQPFQNHCPDSTQLELPVNTNWPRVFLATLSLFITTSGWWAKRVPKRGRQWLLGTGSFVIFVCIALPQAFAVDETPTWPFLLAALAFLYLWWLGIVTFDLAFVWHRYIRNSVAIDMLRQWKRGQDVKPRSIRDGWTRPPPPRQEAP